MSNSVAARNEAVDALAADSRWCSLHTADPGTTGANEAAGSTRGQATFPAAVGGSATATSPGVVNVPAGIYTHYGLWSASSAGTFKQGGLLPSPVTYSVPGTYNLTPTIAAA